MAQSRIADAMSLFSRTSPTKEIAFLNGFLMGMGLHLACPTPNWEHLRNYSNTIDIEKNMREIFESMHKKDIQEAENLLAELNAKKD